MPQDVVARRTTGAIRLDGRLDERDWTHAPVLDRLWEVFPHNLGPARDRTEARFLYDDRYLYVGLRAALASPTGLRKPFVRHDKVGSTHDFVQVHLDPQGSGQASTLFRVNVRGTETDGVQDEAKQTESTDPDVDWEVRTSSDSTGWSAELRIPLSSLRVSRRGAQQWNVIVTRVVPRGQKTQYSSAPWPTEASCTLCLASRLAFSDLKPSPERLIVVPSLAASLRKDRAGAGIERHFAAQASLDAKWLPFRGAAVDIAIKPDFSQVEADSPQFDANQRFAINLPEKRPFFREASDLINTALPLLYTRTITAPDVGLRFTQRSTAINGTAFIAEDGGRGFIVEPGLLSSTGALPDFSSRVGFAHITDRFGSALAGVLAVAKLNADGSFNEVGGIDAAWQSSTDRVTGQLAASRTREPDRPDLLEQWHGEALYGLAAFAEWDHTGSVDTTIRYAQFDPGFRSWLGFVPRVGYRQWHGFLQKPFYPRSPLVARLGPYVSFDRLDAIGGRGYETDRGIGLTIDAARGVVADISWHPGFTLMTEKGEERRLSQFHWMIVAQPSPFVQYVQLISRTGTDIDYRTGDVVPIVDLSGDIRLRPLDRLELEGRYSYLRLGDGPGRGYRLRETIPEALATWFFGPAFYALADLQLHRTERRAPVVESDRTMLASLQLVWEPLLSWRAYAGVRSGASRVPGAPRGSSTEVYFKVTRRLGIGG